MKKTSGTQRIYEYCIQHYGRRLFTTQEIYQRAHLFDIKESSIGGILNQLKKQGKLRTVYDPYYVRGSKKLKKWQVIFPES